MPGTIKIQCKKNEPESCTRLKNVVQKYLNQKDTTASGAPVRRKGNERSKRENRKQGDCNLRLVEGHCSKGDSCSSKHELGSKGNAKSKRDRPRSLSAGRRSPRCDSKDGKRSASQGKVPKGTSPSGKEKQHPCYNCLKEQCTKASCHYWHPHVMCQAQDE